MCVCYEERSSRKWGAQRINCHRFTCPPVSQRTDSQCLLLTDSNKCLHFLSGTNYQSIPVNCPFATTVKNYQVLSLSLTSLHLSLPPFPACLPPSLVHILHLLITSFPLHPMQRDGPMRVDDNQEGAPNYFPNSFGGPEPTPSGE